MGTQRMGNQRMDENTNRGPGDRTLADRFRPGGVAGWLFRRWRSAASARPRLELVERISLAPRQSLALVQAEGRRFLVATSPEGAPAFYALDRALPPAAPRTRVSW